MPAAGGPCRPLALGICPARVVRQPSSSRQQYFASVIGCAQERARTGASPNRIRSREQLLTVRATPDHPLSACCSASVTGQGDLSHRSRAPPLLPSSSVQVSKPQESSQHSQALPGSITVARQPLLYGPAPLGSSAGWPGHCPTTALPGSRRGVGWASSCPLVTRSSGWLVREAGAAEAKPRQLLGLGRSTAHGTVP